MLSRLRALWNQRWLRLLSALVIMALLLDRLDLAVLRGVLARFDVVHGLAMVSVNALLLWLCALRWHAIALALGIAAPRGEFVRVIWLSACLSECGPPLLVGETARFHLMRPFGSRRRVLTSQLLDRVSGYLVLGGIVLLCSPAYAGWFALQSGVWSAAPVGVLLLVGLIRRWSGRGLVGLGRQPEAPVGVIAALLRAPGHYFYSLLIQALLCTNLLLAALGLGVAEQPGRLLLLAPLLLLGVSILPSFWSDWGKREATALWVLAPAGLSAEQALAVSLLFGFSHWLATLPGWGLLWRNRSTDNRPVTPP